ncbi:MAG: hypothetical protein ABI262_11300 [Microcoleus sp.]
MIDLGNGEWEWESGIGNWESVIGLFSYSPNLPISPSPPLPGLCGDRTPGTGTRS